MKLQDELDKRSVDELVSRYALNRTDHPDGRTILMVTDISPKYTLGARQCYGTVIDRNSKRVIARGFDLLLNYEEAVRYQDVPFEFHWDKGIAQGNFCGETVLAYHWNGAWHFSTTSSFLESINNKSVSYIPELGAYLNTEGMRTNGVYIFKLRFSPKCDMMLAGIRFGDSDKGVWADCEFLDWEAGNIGVDRPNWGRFGTKEEFLALEHYSGAEKPESAIAFDDGGNFLKILFSSGGE